MGLWRRLDSIDRRIVARQERNYDEPGPWWVRYSFVISLPLLLSVSFDRAYGGAWWIAVLLSAALWLAVFLRVSAWAREHRRRKSELGGATERHP